MFEQFVKRWSARNMQSSWMKNVAALTKELEGKQAAFQDRSSHSTLEKARRTGRSSDSDISKKNKNQSVSG